MSKLLLPDQLSELRLLEAAIEMMPDFESAARAVVVRVATVLATSVALVERRGSTWNVLADTLDVPAATLAQVTRRLDEAARPSKTASSVRAVFADTTWTCLSVGTSVRRPLWLLCEGDWTLSTPMLLQLAARLTSALAAAARSGSAAARRVRRMQVLARRLARTTEPERVYQLIVDACAEIVNAEKASLALADEEQKSLAIVATHGYPAVLVKQLRFPPNVGIIGTVFRSRRAVRVADVRRVAIAQRPRLRYRTRSFIAVPFVAADRALGVLSVADRQDGREFSRHDLAALRAVSGIVSLALDRVRTVAIAEARERDAAIDAVTGLFTRRYFFARLEEEVARARRDNTPLTMIMIDIDNFKTLNDRLGHQAGDALLRAVGDLVRRAVRVFDVCARYGGDELAVLMPGVGGERSEQVAERIRDELERRHLPNVSWAQDLTMTASFGVAGAAVRTGEELIALADQALYASKQSGKNVVRRAPSDL